MIALDALSPNRHQPRQEFDEGALEQLARSIATAGVMQPIIARPAGAGRYEIVAGERRWRAARKAGLPSVPCLVRSVSDQTAAEWGLIENLQRADLSPLERAEAFHRLQDDFGLTQQEVADRVGLERPTIANHLRLLELEQPIKDALRQGFLSMGHAKALLSVADSSRRIALAAQAMRSRWSVRQLEARARAAGQPARAQDGGADKRLDPGEANRVDLQTKLGEHLGTRVQVEAGRRKGSGALRIEFFDLDQLEGLLQRLGYGGNR